ncbi:MAG: sigma-54 interaction domain-containing protein [Nitrospira sp.]
MLGTSPCITAIRNYLGQVARFNAPLLITGETGTGKELAAEMVHERSLRATQPFVSFNCAAIPESLVENELFGHEKGAFTGADIRRTGLFGAASGGTLFLDEIGDMPIAAQSKLLRVLDSGLIQPLGSARAIPVDVRVVAATNQNLEDRVADGQFRSDLFYRLNVARVQLPPLRERKEDIPDLIGHFLEMFNERMGRQVVGLDTDVRDCLLEYEWPGNVRELRNLVEATLLTIESSMISLKDIPDHYQTKFSQIRNAPFLERERVVSTLLATNWNMSEAAKHLHWSRMTLYRKVAKYSINRPCSAQRSSG